MKIERSWFYLADLNPSRGTEPGKTRPVLVLQTDLLNLIDHPSTIALPLTTRVVENAEPLRVNVPAGTPGFDRSSDVLIDQLRAIDNQHLIKPIAPVPADIMETVIHCVKLVLDLP